MRLLERSLCRAERSGAAVDARSQRPRIDLQEELPLPHPVAFRDRQVDDAAGRVRADVDQPLRLDLS